MGTSLSTSVNICQHVDCAYLFPNLSKIITFAASPLVLTPFVRNQGPPDVLALPRGARAAAGVDPRPKTIKQTTYT